MIKHYLFEDIETGEEFIVGAINLHEAKIIAAGLFGQPEYLYQMSEYEAEASGLDEY